MVEVLCEYDPDSRGGDPADGRKVKGATIHWVDADTAVDAEVRLYDNLFSDADPDGGGQELPGLPEPGHLWRSSPAARWSSLAQADAEAAARHASSSCARATSAWTTRTPQPGHLVFNRSVVL